MKTAVILLASLLAGLVVGTSFAEDLPASTPVARLKSAWPDSAAKCTAEQADRFVVVCQDVEAWANDSVWGPTAKNGETLAPVRSLVAARRQVDAGLNHALEQRVEFAALPAGANQATAVRAYLRITSRAIDLSGRLRYLLRDAIDHAAVAGDTDLKVRGELLEYLLKEQVGIGGGALAYLLFNPAADSGIKAADMPTKQKVLQLMGISGEQAMLEELAEIVADEKAAPELVVAAAETIQKIGLPQEPPADSPESNKPLLTPKALETNLKRLSPEGLSAEVRAAREKLLTSLAKIVKEGVAGDSFRVANVEVMAGDWFLMRNPSPYNLFTDLAPGLFTHVGVVTVKTGSDGIRRFVIVDVPERGEKVPAINVDAYLSKTMHYVFLRHTDPAAGKKMGDVAASIIGNPTQFDLAFRTDRVQGYKGKSLAGETIHTYCAGLLLLLAQETGRPRSEFFPLAEHPAGGNFSANLKTLGLAMGDDFVSPTGALFSAQLKLVGRREPMYEPGREIEEAIYDAFADSMIRKVLKPSPDAAQATRQTLAELSKTRPWLARRLAKANNVSEKLDLETAAKAGAVVETLDQIAEGNRDAFEQAREAILAPPPEKLAAEGYKPDEIERIAAIRKQHADLYAKYAAGGLTPREVRLLLVKHFTNLGVTQVDARFFR